MHSSGTRSEEVINPCQLNCTTVSENLKSHPFLDGFPLLRRGGSNSRPTGYEPVELPLLYFAVLRCKGKVIRHTIQRKTGTICSGLTALGLWFMIATLLIHWQRHLFSLFSPLHHL